MDHEYIDSKQVIERYLMDKLSPEEREAFELHYLSCQDCLNQIDAAEVLQNELPGIDRGSDSKTFQTHTRPARLWSSILRSPAYNLAATVLLGAALITIVYTFQTRKEESAVRRELNARFEDFVAPQPNTPVVRLSIRRGAGSPAAQVQLPADPGPIVLVLELSDVGYTEYRATMIEPAGETAWAVESLVPDVTDSLVVTVHSTTLDTGDYRLSVEGRREDGEWQNVAGYGVRFQPTQ